jgi:hypothetical protein
MYVCMYLYWIAELFGVCVCKQHSREQDYSLVYVDQKKAYDNFAKMRLEMSVPVPSV